MLLTHVPMNSEMKAAGKEGCLAKIKLILGLGKGSGSPES